MRPDLAAPLSSWQVLEVVRSNYDTLTLKLQDGLDQFERYSEQPKEVAFFKELVRRWCSAQHFHLIQSAAWRRGSGAEKSSWGGPSLSRRPEE